MHHRRVFHGQGCSHTVHRCEEPGMWHADRLFFTISCQSISRVSFPVPIVLNIFPPNQLHHHRAGTSLALVRLIFCLRLCRLPRSLRPALLVYPLLLHAAVKNEKTHFSTCMIFMSSSSMYNAFTARALPPFAKRRSSCDPSTPKNVRHGLCPFRRRSFRHPRVVVSPAEPAMASHPPTAPNGRHTAPVRAETCSLRPGSRRGVGFGRQICGPPGWGK